MLKGGCMLYGAMADNTYVRIRSHLRQSLKLRNLLKQPKLQKMFREVRKFGGDGRQQEAPSIPDGYHHVMIDKRGLD